MMRKTLETYLRFCYSQDLSPHTRNRRERWVSRWLAFTVRIGTDPWAASWEDASDYVFEVQQEGFSKDSIGQLIVCLRHFYEWAVMKGYTQANPFRFVQKPKLDDPLPRDMPLEDVEAMLHAVNGNGLQDVRDRALLEFFVSTGCRIGELIGADLSGLDVHNRRCRVMRKGRREGILYLTPRAAAWLERYLREVRPLWATEEKSIFVGRQGKRICQQSVDLVVKRTAERAGLTYRPSAHRFRHTFATQLLRNGCDLRVVAALMDHQNIKNTQRYTRVVNRQAEIAMERYHPLADLEGDGNSAVTRQADTPATTGSDNVVTLDERRDTGKRRDHGGNVSHAG